MDHSTDACVVLSKLDTTQVLAPNHSSQTKHGLPCKQEKSTTTHAPNSPKDGKREAPLAVECTGECTRERLKKHRQEMAGQVWIPDIWGQEGFLKDWKDNNMFDRSLVPKGLVSARDALKEECRRSANSNRSIRVQNSC